MMTDRFRGWFLASIIYCLLPVAVAEVAFEPEEATPELVGPYNPVVDADCMGTAELEQGEQFTGTLKDGLPQGRGEIAYPNGDVFSGIFKIAGRQVKARFSSPTAIVSRVTGFVIDSLAA